MGLPFSIHVRGGGRSVTTAVERVWSDLQQADTRFSPYLPDSEVSLINRGRSEHSTVMTEMLNLAERARLRTGGAFDIRYRGDLEPCGLVKGWAASRAATHLDALGLDYYLNAGGDVAASAGDQTFWQLGIEHPLDSNGLLAVVRGHKFALATSGSAHRGQHILNPFSGRPAPGLIQVSVIGPELVWADVLATALIAAGQIGQSILAEFPDYGVLGFSAEHRVLATPVMAAYLESAGWSN